MSVLINGSTSKDFKVEKGFRQGDPLSLFLFVLVMEVLTALMRKAKSIGEFRGFKINDNEEVDTLQFADDTIIISEGDTANLWNAASSFLSCKVGNFPFKFLGVKVGGNHMNLSMWKDLISMLRKRLAEWRGTNLNIAGRVVLINSVLNAIPIYLLSFYKAPVKWRNLSEDEAVWQGILEARYGNLKVKVLIGDSSLVGKKDSIWWRDILISDNYAFLHENHFAGAVECHVGNGENISFWYATWTSQQQLKEAFPELFQATHNHMRSVAEVGSYTVDGWKWDVQKLVHNDSAVSSYLLQ
ncbi:uncharacterized protein LOC131623896 [Vicia villosa]|uniref:uncharacterized protein LOC131623896 n=1 Tax=Vicia villosa TaxID=3911 RepID=UPI00273ADADC|nr:uncharacterized protein LOC131623896 [Vicia villosa]